MVAVIIYLAITFVTAAATLEDTDKVDIQASIICGLLWPLFIPIRILRRMI